MKYIQQYIVGQLVKVVVHISRRHFYKGNNSPQCTFAVTVTHSSLPLVDYCGGVWLLASVFVCNRLHISARSVFCLVEKLHYRVAANKKVQSVCLFSFTSFHLFIQWFTLAVCVYWFFGRAWFLLSKSARSTMSTTSRFCYIWYTWVHVYYL